MNKLLKHILEVSMYSAKFQFASMKEHSFLDVQIKKKKNVKKHITILHLYCKFEGSVKCA